MNLRKKSRSKLRIFGSFSSKVRQYRSETDLTEKSTPVLLGVRPTPETPESSLTSRSFSVSLSGSSVRLRSSELAPGSLLSLPHLESSGLTPTSLTSASSSNPTTNSEISLFEKHYVVPLQNLPTTRVSPPSSPSLSAALSGSNVSDDISHTDSGAFSCVSSPVSPAPSLPDRGARPDTFLPPLLSPPLVLSVSRAMRNTNADNTDGEAEAETEAEVEVADRLEAEIEGRVTVTVGTLTRLCINDSLIPVPPPSLNQYQSLPNLNSRVGERGVAGKQNKMPHMGLSRLVNCPSKPPRFQSSASTWQERSRITTSTTALLNRSNTLAGWQDRNKIPSPDMRTFRGSSCSSDTSSGVYSATSASVSMVESEGGSERRYNVTVNGQLL